MAEFIMSRLKRNSEEEISRKTILLGLLTLLVFILVIVFGLPVLVRFSILLGDLKSGRESGVKEKVLPPLPPRLVVSYEATNSSEIVISGFAQPKMTVELLKNEVMLARETVGDNGEFSFAGVTLDEGINSFEAVARLEEGGSSEASRPVEVVFDRVLPELSLTRPESEELKVQLASYEVVGKSEKGASVWVNNRVAMVGDEGNFKIQIELSIGRNEVEVAARDLAGNEVRKKVVIIYDI